MAGGPAAGLAGAAAAGATAAGFPGALAGSAGAAANAAGSAGGWGSKVADAALEYGPAVAGAIGASMADRGPTSSPEIQAGMDQQRQRLEMSNPLYQSVLRLAHGRLPMSAQAGGGIPSYADVDAGIPQVEEGGDYTEDAATRRLLRAQQVRSKMSDPLYAAILRLAQGRMPNAV